MRKGEITKQRIVALAAPVFNQRGFAGAALSDLMEATGLKKGGIYRHFASKEALASDSFDYAWKIAIGTRLDGLDRVANSVDRLVQMIRNFKDRRSGLVPGGCPLLNAAVDSDDGNPLLRARARRALYGWLRRMRTIAKEGQLRGEIRADVNTGEMAALIASTLEGSMMLSRLQQSAAPIELACSHLVDYLENEVRSCKAKHTKPSRPSHPLP